MMKKKVKSITGALLKFVVKMLVKPTGSKTKSVLGLELEFSVSWVIEKPSAQLPTNVIY